MTGSAVGVDRMEPGRIFEIARAAGIAVPEKGDKRPIRCPIHDDKHASAFLSVRNVFYCSRCTPDGGWTAKEFAAAIAQPWGACMPAFARPIPTPKVDERPSFTPQDAQLVWSLALARARDDEAVAADSEAYAYLAERGILESWELGAFGVLASDPKLPKAVAWWPSAGYRVVAPLYDQDGKIASVQARSIVGREPKTLFPSGSRSARTAFASTRAAELLRSSHAAHDAVLLGEGLTDFLALSAATAIPVFCAPGTGFAAGFVGAWVCGRALLLALDVDAAGALAVDPVAQAAKAHGARRVVRVTWPPGCKDACDVVREHGLLALSNFLERGVELARA